MSPSTKEGSTRNQWLSTIVVAATMLVGSIYIVRSHTPPQPIRVEVPVDIGTPQFQGVAEPAVRFPDDDTRSLDSKKLARALGGCVNSNGVVVGCSR